MRRSIVTIIGHRFEVIAKGSLPRDGRTAAAKIGTGMSFTGREALSGMTAAAKIAGRFRKNEQLGKACIPIRDHLTTTTAEVKGRGCWATRPALTMHTPGNQ